MAISMNRSNNQNINLATAKALILQQLQWRNMGCEWLTPYILEGASGIGKTQIIYEIARENGYNCIAISLATANFDTFLPMPNLHRNSENAPKEFPPNFLVRKGVINGDGIDSNKPTIYFLDELNRSEDFAKNAIFSLLAEGKIGNFSLGQYDIIVGAQNPAGQDFIVNDFQDKAFLNRGNILNITFDPTEWVKYVHNKDLNIITSNIFSHFMKENGNLIDFSVVTPRTITNVVMETNRYILAKINLLKSEVFNAYLNSSLGNSLAISYLNAVEQCNKYVIDIAKIISCNKDFINYKEVLSMKDFDEKASFCSDIAKKIKDFLEKEVFEKLSEGNDNKAFTIFGNEYKNVNDNLVDNNGNEISLFDIFPFLFETIATLDNEYQLIATEQLIKSNGGFYPVNWMVDFIDFQHLSEGKGFNIKAHSEAQRDYTTQPTEPQEVTPNKLVINGSMVNSLSDSYKGTAK